MHIDTSSLLKGISKVLPSDWDEPKRAPETIDFTQSEVLFFERVRDLAEKETERMEGEQKHRLLIGCASALIDHAADITAEHHPGLRVVELSILAERLERIALGYPRFFKPDDDRS